MRHVATLSESNKNRMVVSDGSNGSNGKNQDVDSVNGPQSKLNGPQLNDSILQSIEGDTELLGEGEEQDEDKERDKATASMVAEAEGSRGGAFYKEEEAVELSMAVEAIEAINKKADTPVLDTNSNSNSSSSSSRVHTEQSQQLQIQTGAIQNVHVHSATNTPIHTSTHALTSPNSISSLHPTHPTQQSSTVFPSRPAHSSPLPTHPSVPSVPQACRSIESHHGNVSGSAGEYTCVSTELVLG